MKVARVFFLMLLVAAMAIPSLAIPPIHLRGISVGVGYSHFSGPYYPYYYVPYYPGWYPAWTGWDPFWYPYASPMAYNQPNADKGEVHLKDVAPQSEVYVDGAYAGLAKDLRTMWLAPGVYNVEVRSANRASVEKKIYVLTGKKLDVRMAEVKQ